MLVFGRFFLLGWIVRRGDFDRYLIRPLSPFLQIVVERVRVSSFGDLLCGVILFGAAYLFWLHEVRAYQSAGH